MPVNKSKTSAEVLPDRLTDDDVSLKKLSFGLWYVRHRRLFLNIIIVVLIIFSASGWIYSFYVFGRYFIFDREKDQQMMAEMAQTTVNLLAGHTNQPLTISDVEVLGSKPNNLVAKIYNPNLRTAVFFKYSFVVNEQVLVQRDGFVLPGQTKYLVALNQNIPPGALVYLKIEQANWERLDPRKIPNWPAFLAERDQFVIADKQINLANNSSQLVSQIKFRLENHSAYGYWSVPILMMAYQGDDLVDVNELVLSKVRAGEVKNIIFAWPGLKNVNYVEIVPMINFLDQNNYLPVD